MNQEPVQIPVKGDPIRASWGASVANGINSCAEELAALRRPGRLESLRENPPETPDAIYPFKVRFVAYPEGDGTEGTYIIYIPEGSLTANGEACEPNMFELAAYTPEDDPEGFPDWYVLSAPGADAGYWLWFEYEVSESAFAGATIETAPVEIGGGGEEDGGSTVQRCVALATIDITPAAPGTPGSVKVRQTTRGPISYEFAVLSLNKKVGHLSIKGDEDGGVDIDGKRCHIVVRDGEDAGEILVDISDGTKKDDDDDDGCSHPGTSGGGAPTPPGDGTSVDSIGGVAAPDEDGDGGSQSGGGGKHGGGVKCCD